MVVNPGNRVAALAVGMLLSLVLSAPAAGWAWPVDGPVLRPFAADGDPYAGGQHRGIDVGLADAHRVRAPASGEISFAGQVPTHGLTVTIATGDGHKASLTHLGNLLVRRGDRVSEGDAVAEAGSSGDAEHDEPYVHLGIRVGEAETYVDPLSAFNLVIAVNAIAMPMIGGTATWYGPVVGALLLGGVQEIATVTISSEANVLIVGVLLVLFVIAAPQGIVGLVQGFWRRRRRHG